MADTKSSAKLFQILKEQNFSTMGFERRLGLGIAELEQYHSILRGKTEITEDLAKQINNLFLLRIIKIIYIKKLADRDIVKFTNLAYRHYIGYFLSCLIPIYI